MADDVNAKEAEKVENKVQGDAAGEAAGAADRFRDELVNNPNGARIGNEANSMQGMKDSAGKAESTLPSIDLGQGKGGGASLEREAKKDPGNELKQGKDLGRPSDDIKNPLDHLKQGGGALGKPEQNVKNPVDDLKGGSGKENLADYLHKDGTMGGGGKNELPNGIGDKLGDKAEMLKDMDKMAEEEIEDKDGVEQLPTGDHIVREDGKESLFTPGGDRITLNPDGSHTIKGDVKRVETKDGVTTVTFKDGGEVAFDQDGFLSVQRGNQGVAFGRQGSGGYGGGGYKDGEGGGGGGKGDPGAPWHKPGGWGDPMPKPDSPKLEPKFHEPLHQEPIKIGPEWMNNKKK